MSCSHLSQVLNPDQLSKVENALRNLSSNSIITASKFALWAEIDIATAFKVLSILVDTEALSFHFYVRCPECGILIKEADNPLDIDADLNCDYCDDEVHLTTDDIEVAYKVRNLPFASGRQVIQTCELAVPAVPNLDTLTQLFKSGAYNLYNCLYAPSEEQYQRLAEKYLGIFEVSGTAKSKGDTLETLVTEMFSLCSKYRVSGLKLKPNQIDCFVRSIPTIPDLPLEHLYDSFMIECKNETHKPEITYLNKMHSILNTHGKKFGIIVSKIPPPRTYADLANKLYLKENIVIISIEALTLKSIVFGKVNLLECIERKVQEVKLNAVSDLVTAGLYSG